MMQSVGMTGPRPKWSIFISMRWTRLWLLMCSLCQKALPTIAMDNVCHQLSYCMIGSLTKVCVRNPGSQCPPCLYKSKLTSEYYCYNLREGLCPYPHPDVICINVHQPVVAAGANHVNVSSQNKSQVGSNTSNAKYDDSKDHPTSILKDSMETAPKVNKTGAQLSTITIIIMSVLITFMVVLCGCYALQFVRRRREDRAVMPPFAYVRSSTVLSIEDGSNSTHHMSKQTGSQKLGGMDGYTAYQSSDNTTASFQSDGNIAGMFASKLEQSRNNHEGILSNKVSRMSPTEASMFYCDVSEEEGDVVHARNSDTPMIELDLAFMEENCDYDIVDPETFYSSQIRTSEAIVEAGRYSAYSQVSSTASAAFNFPCSLESNILEVD